MHSQFDCQRWNRPKAIPFPMPIGGNHPVKSASGIDNPKPVPTQKRTISLLPAGSLRRLRRQLPPGGSYGRVRLLRIVLLTGTSHFCFWKIQKRMGSSKIWSSPSFYVCFIYLPFCNVPILRQSLSISFSRMVPSLAEMVYSYSVPFTRNSTWYSRRPSSWSFSALRF